MKTISTAQLLLTILFCGFVHAANAFQVADGTPPAQAPASKFIFYWGKQQCDLLETNEFKNRITLTPAEFRQMLLATPKIWNGKELVYNFQFTIADVPVATNNYLAQLETLNAQLGPKIVTGNLLQLQSLTLDEGISGSIGFLLEESEKEPNTIYGNAPNQTRITVNNQLIDKAVWGREEVFELSNRDFFTVGEFWQNLCQEPVVIWKPYVKPQAIGASINFSSPEMTNFGVNTTLEEGSYQGWLSTLENYRYMVRPDASITMLLQTTEQYDVLYKKTITIVADNDPRLRLRRKRDLHEVTIKWASWNEHLADMYLQKIATPNGDSILVDLPVARQNAMVFGEPTDSLLGNQKPQCWIDDEPVTTDISFRLTVADSIHFMIHSNDYDPAEMAQYLNLKALNNNYLTIDSIQIEGYVLPPVKFRVFILGGARQVDFSSLMKEVSDLGSTRLSLMPPGENDLFFKIKLPETTAIKLLIFDAAGKNVYNLRDVFGPGESTLTVSKSKLPAKGKYYAFLSTFYGVVKVEFEL